MKQMVGTRKKSATSQLGHEKKNILPENLPPPKKGKKQGKKKEEGTVCSSVVPLCTFSAAHPTDLSAFWTRSPAVMPMVVGSDAAHTPSLRKENK